MTYFLLTALVPVVCCVLPLCSFSPVSLFKTGISGSILIVLSKDLKKKIIQYTIKNIKAEYLYNLKKNNSIQ